MAKVSDVFDAAMSIADELSSSGLAQNADNMEYQYRTPAIVTMLTGEILRLTGNAEAFEAVTAMTDDIPATPDDYAMTVMPYGLAANLLTIEDPAAASFYQQRYEELRDRFASRLSPSQGQIEDVYSHTEWDGGIPYGWFSRWP